MSDNFLEIAKTLEKHKKNVKKDMSKELQLITALRPFMPESNHEKMDSMLEMFATLSAFKSIKGESNIGAANRDADGFTDDSIHEDGVYDISKSGSNPSQLLTLLLLLQM